MRLGKNIRILDLVDYAHSAETEESVYFKLDGWFEWKGDAGWIFHTDKLPEDLNQFITKAGLGGENPQIKKPKV